MFENLESLLEPKTPSLQASSSGKQCLWLIFRFITKRKRKLMENFKIKGSMAPFGNPLAPPMAMLKI